MLSAGNLPRAALSQPAMNAFVLVVLAASAFDEGTQMKNVGEYARAAELYERHAREQPTDANAKAALREALLFRMALHDDAAALADAELYLRAYGSDAEAPTVAAAVVLHAADEEDWPAVMREAARKMTVVDHGPIGLRMETHAALARAFAASHDPRAKTEYARVRDMSRDLHEPADGDGRAMRRFAKGLDVYGEALVFAADERRDATTWAPLAANATESAIDAWVVARSAQIRAVEAEYMKVAEVQPVPPVRWVVAGAGRSAAMWARAADELVAKLPAKKRAARVALRDVDAKRAAKACIDWSAKYQYVDDGVRASTAWLEKTFRREYPPLDELVIAPRLRAFGLAPQSPLPHP